MKSTFLAAAASLLVLASCQKDPVNQNKDVILQSAEQTMGNGKVKSALKLDGTGKPQALFVTFTKGALQNLPTGHGEGEHTHGASWVLPIPGQAGITPFDHIGLDWNPHGHEPEAVYGLAHFDFHFYLMPLQERLAIPPFDVDPTGFQNLPAADFLPANYINIPGGVPQMGTHWIDMFSPELDPVNPQPFTETFIYGSYNGKVNFLEPMITRQFLLDMQNFERSIPQPAKYEKAGYYPTKMHIKHTAETISVILDGFQLRNAG